MIETIALILSLKPTIDQYLASSQLTSQAEVVTYAYIKAIEIVAKALLSKSLPFQTQSELATFIATILGLASKDLILTSLIELTLVTLRGAQSDLVKKSALRILVHLTVTKPYVPAEKREMHIRYFIMELPALVSLKDYICSCITQMGETCTDRPAIKSLTQLMCEFDTMSDRGEVLDALYTSVITAMATQQSISGLCARISDFRGIVEGTFR